MSSKIIFEIFTDAYNLFLDYYVTEAPFQIEIVIGDLMKQIIDDCDDELIGRINGIFGS